MENIQSWSDEPFTVNEDDSEFIEGSSIIIFNASEFAYQLICSFCRSQFSEAFLTRLYGDSQHIPHYD